MRYIENLFNISGKVAVITGGSGVLGSKMAEGLLKVGVKVVILGTNEEKLQGKLKYLSSIGKDIIGFKCDVLNENNIKYAKRNREQLYFKSNKGSFIGLYCSFFATT